MKQHASQKKAPERVEGEGSYDASRRYREGLEASIREGKTEELAKEAEKALEGPEGKTLRAAEEKAKHARTPDRANAPRR